MKTSSAYGFAVKCRKATFAELLINMDRSYMSTIDGGKVNVTLAVLEKLAKALDVPAYELLK